MARVAWFVILWLVLAGLYLLFSGTVDGVEIAGAVFCASIATALAFEVTRVAKRHYAFALPLRAVWRPLAALIPEFVTVGRELVAAIIAGPGRQRGDFVHQPFEPGALEDDRASTRRAVSIIGMSMAPRTFVVRGERSDELLLHGFPAKTPSADRQWPA